jgi:hypothetical protein
MPKKRTPVSSPPDPDALYQRYVKPLEPTHKDQYVLVTPSGQTVLAPTLLEAVQEASKVPSKDNFIFKVGQKSVGTIG